MIHLNIVYGPRHQKKSLGHLRAGAHMQPVRYLVRNATGKSHGSPKMFSTSVMRGEILRRNGMKQKEQKNTGKQIGGFRRQ